MLSITSLKPMIYMILYRSFRPAGHFLQAALHFLVELSFASSRVVESRTLYVHWHFNLSLRRNLTDFHFSLSSCSNPQSTISISHILLNPRSHTPFAFGQQLHRFVYAENFELNLLLEISLIKYSCSLHPFDFLRIFFLDISANLLP